jgi:hypothetical protein
MPSIPIGNSPWRGTVRSTRTRLARTIIMGVLAGVTIPLAQAQLTYTYIGHRLGGQWEGGQITAKLTTDEIIPNNSTAPLGRGTAQPCPKTWTFTIVVGSTVFESQNAYRSSCYYFRSAGNALLPAFISLGIQQGDELGGTEVELCSHIHHRTYDHLRCGAYQIGRIVPLTKSMNYDWAGTLDSWDDPRARRESTYVAESGKWSPPKPADITTALLMRLTAMNIQEQGSNLIAQITSVLNDMNDGAPALACTDLQSFENHVKAETGKAISPVDAETILKWVGYISAGLPCTAK